MQCLKNDLECKEIESIPYAYVVGSFLYAQICIRSDINFAVEMLNWYQRNFELDHWKAVKKSSSVFTWHQGLNTHVQKVQPPWGGRLLRFKFC